MTNRFSLPIWLVVLLIGLAAGGAAFVMNATKTKTIEAQNKQLANYSRQIDTIKSQNTSLEDELNQLRTGDKDKTDEVKRLESQLLEARLRLQLSYQNVEYVLRDGKNPMIFYYVSNPGNNISREATIFKYDASKDKQYVEQKNPVPSVGESVVVVYQEKLKKNMEIRLVGIDGDRLVFTVTGEDNSPGPCFSEWEYDTLLSIDTSLKIPEKQTYTLSEEKKKEVKIETDKCAAQL